MTTRTTNLDALSQKCQQYTLAARGRELAAILSMDNYRDLSPCIEEYLSIRTTPADLSSLINEKFSTASFEIMGTLMEKRLQAGGCVATRRWKDAASLVQSMLNDINGFMEIATQRGDALFGRWWLPVLWGTCRDVRILAQQADRELKMHELGADTLKSTEVVIKKSFTICVSDRRTDDQNLLLGSLEVMNQLFKCYFKLNTIRLCANVLRTFESKCREKDILSYFQTPHLATYYYFLGRLKCFEGSFEESEKHLKMSLHLIPLENSLGQYKFAKQRRSIMRILIPVRMLRGCIPKPQLLRQYGVLEYADFCQALQTGDLRMYRVAMEKNFDLFCRRGVQNVMERVRMRVLKRLFYNVYRINNRNSRVDLDLLLTGVNYLGEDMDMVELECLIASMIYHNFMKGYISHKKQILVLSKDNAFPVTANFV